MVASRNGVATPKKSAKKSAKKSIAPKSRLPKGTELKEKRVVDVDENTFGLLTVHIESITPLIMNQFPAKAIRMMEEKQQAKARPKKAPKNPEEDFLGAMHIIGPRPKTEKDLGKTRFGFPAKAFKAGLIRAAKMSGTPMTEAKGAVLIFPEDPQGLVEIFPEELPHMRTDPVRIQTTTDIRYRPQFDKWTAKLDMEYDARSFTPEQIIQWLNRAGKSIGLGEMRPFGKESTSSDIYGCFKVVSATVQEPDLSDS